MFSVPGQSLESWAESLARTVAMEPDHVSTYCLTYEEDTEFFRRLQSGAYHEDHERDARFYEMTQDALLSNGYAQYEVSNFARAGHESLHNSAYWDGADYLGFGPGAFSTLGLERWENVRDTKAYVEGMLSGTPVVNFRETLSEPVRTAEIMAFRMRTQRGVSTTAAAPYEAALRPYVEAGHVEKVGDVIRLTRSGILHADGVAELFIAEPEPR
jgi:oxygen-independent coproporphyrinogen-3 oxidase